MPAWQMVTIDRDGDETNQWQRLQDSFEKVFLASGGPHNAAMYSDRERDLSKTTLYFSPGAVAIFGTTLTLHDGQRCERPSSDDVSLLVGHDDARDTSTVD
jgi:hypothetical protein